MRVLSNLRPMVPVCWALAAVMLTGIGVPANAQLTPEKVEKRGVTFEMALKALHEKTGISIVADANPKDTYPYRDAEWLTLPPEQAIRKLAAMTGYDVFLMDGVYILRSKRWAEMLRQARRDYVSSPASTEEDTASPGPGFVEIKRLDPTPDADYVQPAREISVSVRRGSCAALARELEKQAAVTLTVDPDLKLRRFHAFARTISPSLMVGCLGFLINSGPELTLRQSDAQKKAQKMAENDDLPDYLKKRVRASEKLRSDVLKALTPEQSEALKNGQKVELSLTDLPDGLRQRALDYITLSSQLYQGQNLVAPPNLAKKDEFGLIIDTPGQAMLWYMLFIRTTVADGSQYIF